MSSKLVLGRQKSATAVTAAAETHAGPTAAAITKTLASCLQQGEAMPDVALLLRLIGRFLSRACAEMVIADAAHTAELGDDDAPREARDKAAADLYAKLVELREIVTGLYGADAVKAFGLSGATPQDPVALSGFAGDVVKALGAKPLPASRVKGAQVDAKATAQALVKERATLETSLADVARETREAQQTLSVKNTALAGYDDAFGRAASALVGLLRLSGDAELAERLRPSARHPGQVEQPPADPPALP